MLMGPWKGHVLVACLYATSSVGARLLKLEISGAIIEFIEKETE